METNLSEIGAFALERRLIKLWGRASYGDGILHNILPGGPSGCVSVATLLKRLISRDVKIKAEEAKVKAIMLRKEAKVKEKILKTEAKIKTQLERLINRDIKIKAEEDKVKARILKTEIRLLNKQTKDAAQPIRQAIGLAKMIKAKLGISYVERLGIANAKKTQQKQSEIHKIIQNNRNRVCHIKTRKEYDINTFTTKFLRTEAELIQTIDRRRKVGSLVQSNRPRVCHVETRKEYDVSSFQRWVLNECKNNRICHIDNKKSTISVHLPNYFHILLNLC